MPSVTGRHDAGATPRRATGRAGTDARVVIGWSGRHNARGNVAPVLPMDTRIPPPLLAIVLAACAWGLDGLNPDLRQVFAWQMESACFLLAAGLACTISGVLAFRMAKTTVDPLHPERASQLVVLGIYRRTRNPMYLGLLLLLAAWAVYLGQPLALIALPLWIGYVGRFQIRPEEAALRRRFGSSYVAYCNTVRRWI